MTTLAEASPPLRRLFDRLDFAPSPAEPALGSALSAWTRLRGRDAAPKWPAPTGGLGARSAVFLRKAGTRDYELAWKGSAFEALPDPLAQGATLASARGRRGALHG